MTQQLILALVEKQAFVQDTIVTANYSTIALFVQAGDEGDVETIQW